MERHLAEPVKADLDKKIVFITGPRQSGKTTLARMMSNHYDYFNFDNPEHRIALIRRSWDRSKELVILDELHKMKKWKSFLKGVYDTEGARPRLLVTGSARLDTYRKAGDSLAGRFFQFRLHPLDLKEIKRYLDPPNPDEALDLLLKIGGFPEPFLNGESRFYNRWKKTHLDIIIRQDLVEIENIHRIAAIETLIELLRRRVGSPISFSSLATDLQVSDKTVKNWLSVLENMYIVFKVTPYHSNVARSLLKLPKYYFYDTGQVIGDEGARFENLVACALLKELQYREDCDGERTALHYVKRKDGQEIDFLAVVNDEPVLLMETKWSDGERSPQFRAFAGLMEATRKKIQLVRTLDREKTYPDGVEVRAAVPWLAAMEF